ncbi:bifunctional transcriptional activator/DNA repair enzyme AdaA [Paenibacillus sp. N1-5-1-14]|uniref:bifunctional transcriptional activator/DNA repair enzyme AdaA n=1 Tax=Paenibacillus radicibacter TaxID=2972488 RepID=UPI002159AE52|nr:bifunctional transcriptional activator/DNA repair enzyme AdaA [Paenibacillus radicibacter]MCR8644628.1 bifunctional transcriptional activator/DNA repair enzyme AdaA [Paenibacillus radicibacter]
MTHKPEHDLSDEKWQAILSNDSTYDRTFIYAVKTTGIFCKPSCKSKAPLKSNVRIFNNYLEALRDGFRPCKRCKPTGEKLPNEEWVAQMKFYIDNHFHENLSLEKLADHCHGSPYHLHRVFKQVTGLTPVNYIQQLRINKACELLDHSNLSIAEIAEQVGIPNTPYFITLFKKKTGLTPAAYRDKQIKEMKEEKYHDESIS